MTEPRERACETGQEQRRVRVRAAFPRLTSAGALVLVGATGLLSVSFDSRLQPQVLWLVHVLFAVVVAALLSTWWSTRRLEVGLTLPRTAFAGRTGPVQLIVRQGAWCPGLALEVRLVLGASAGTVLPHLPHVPMGGCVRVEANVPFETRGIHTAARVVVTSAPFHLCRCVVTADLSVGLTVFPAVELLERTPVAPGSPVSASGDATLARPGQDTEFLGLRPYVPGDSPRRVHWPASARTGRLQVREHARPSTADVTLLADLPEDNSPAAEEDLVSVVASIALHLHLRAIRTQLWLAGATPRTVPTGGGRSHHEGLQDALTRARGGGASLLGALLRHHGRALPAGSALVVIAMRSLVTREVRGLLDEIQGAGVRPVLILLAPEHYVSAAGPPESAIAAARGTKLDRGPAMDVPPEWTGARTGPVPVFVPGRPLRLADVLRRIG